VTNNGQKWNYESGKILADSLNSKQLKLIQAWIEIHRE
jgi:hypothetical protein